MEWPYEHPRRGDMPPGHHALTLNEYTIRQPPYAAGLKHSNGLLVRAGLERPRLLARTSSSTRRSIPYTGTNYAWVRARCLGGKTNIWGRLALRLSDFDFKAKSRDGYGEDWPISYKDIAPYYDRVDQYLGISGVKENLPHLPDSIFQRPTRLNAAEVTLAQHAEEDGPRAHAVSRRRDDRRAEAQQVSQPLLRARRVQPPRRRLRHPRGVRLADRPDLSGDGHRQPDAANQRDRARDPGRHDDGQGARRRVRRRRERTQPTRRRAKVVVVAASTLESARLLLLSKSPSHPNGIGNSSGHVGHNFCEHVMGPSVTGLVKDRIGKPRTNRRRAAGRVLRAALPQPVGQASEFHSRLRIRGQLRHHDVSRQRARHAGLRRRATRSRCATTPARSSAWAASARCCRATRTSVDLDPAVKDTWGIPVLRFNYRFGDNEKKMCEDMAETAQEMFERAGFEIVNVDRDGPDRGLVDPRAGHGAHGHGPEDVGAESVPAVARRQQPVRRRRQQPRQRVVPEPDVDDHGAGLAVVRLPGRPSSGRGTCERRNSRRRRARSSSAPPRRVAASIDESTRRRSAAAAPRRRRFFTRQELALVDELSEMIIPTDDHSPGARAAKVAAYIDARLAEAFDAQGSDDVARRPEADRAAVATGDRPAVPRVDAAPSGSRCWSASPRTRASRRRPRNSSSSS